MSLDPILDVWLLSLEQKFKRPCQKIESWHEGSRPRSAPAPDLRASTCAPFRNVPSHNRC